uniref:Uncharacterized protein n=1 Tax=Vespula pensylvanica TaxID=30213 RepID=A0A834KRJ8_VESPE|nr:hypothetical protein H0235_013723 [Vespula pensylvanica]
MGDIRKSSRVSPRRGGGGGGEGRGGGGAGGGGGGGRDEEIVSRIKYAEEEEEEEEEEEKEEKENKTVVRRIDRARNGATFQRARRIVRELSFGFALTRRTAKRWCASRKIADEVHPRGRSIRRVRRNGSIGRIRTDLA